MSDTYARIERRAAAHDAMCSWLATMTEKVREYSGGSRGGSQYIAISALDAEEQLVRCIVVHDGLGEMLALTAEKGRDHTQCHGYSEESLPELLVDVQTCTACGVARFREWHRAKWSSWLRDEPAGRHCEPLAGVGRGTENGWENRPTRARDANGVP